MREGAEEKAPEATQVPDGLTLRPPRPGEIEEVARLWVRSFDPKPHTKRGDRFVRVGEYRSTSVAPHVWEQAHRAYVDHRLEHDAVLVADVDGGLAGFASFSMPTARRPSQTLHYLYVLRPGRRRGIGRHLFEAVRRYAPDTPLRTTHTTGYWERFLAGVTRRC